MFSLTGMCNISSYLLFRKINVSEMEFDICFLNGDRVICKLLVEVPNFLYIVTFFRGKVYILGQNLHSHYMPNIKVITQ